MISDDQDSGEVRAERIAQRRNLLRIRAELTPSVAGRSCGKKPTGTNVPVRLGKSGAHFGGLQHCHSVWSCADCSATIRNRRAADIDQLLTKHFARGGVVFFLTLTLPHTVNDSLRESLGTLHETYERSMSGKMGQKYRDIFGVVGSVKATEITYGRNGWHPHLHVLVLAERWPSDAQWLPHDDLMLSERPGAQLDEFRRWWDDRWPKALRASQWSAPAPGIGAVADECVERGDALARYVAKVQDGGRASSVSMEVARFDLKLGRGSSFTPFDLLVQYAQSDPETDPQNRRRLAALWREYEQVTAGRHAIRWSRGLYREYEITMLTDDEIADAADRYGDVVAVLDEWEYRAVRRQDVRDLVLQLAEAHAFDDMWAVVRNALETDRRDGWPPEFHAVS